MEITDSKFINSETQALAKRSANAGKPFGKLFTETRKKKKISIEQVVNALYIRRHQLQALEDERFEDLPYYTFSRSFAVKYAEYLGLKGTEIAQKFDAIYPNELKMTKDPLCTSVDHEITNFDLEDEKTLQFNPILFLAFIAVLALAVFLSKQVSTAEEEHKKTLPIDEGISKVEQRQGAMLDGYK